MVVDPHTIQGAFDSYVRRYASEGWPISDHLKLYGLAQKGFEGDGDIASFRKVYDALRKYWKVFRGTKGSWDADKVFGELKALPLKIRRQKLSNLQDSEWKLVWDCIYRLRDIKPNKAGPSLVAISKFLHFWNPRVFVIVDHEMMWSWALKHWGLRDQITSANEVLLLSGLNPEAKSTLTDYLKILYWASSLIRANPYIRTGFVNTIRTNAGEAKIPAEIDTYEATAVEWFLLGLVELPPEGVKL